MIAIIRKLLKFWALFKFFFKMPWLLRIGVTLTFLTVLCAGMGFNDAMLWSTVIFGVYQLIKWIFSK